MGSVLTPTVSHKYRHRAVAAHTVALVATGIAIRTVLAAARFGIALTLRRAPPPRVYGHCPETRIERGGQPRRLTGNYFARQLEPPQRHVVGSHRPWVNRRHQPRAVLLLCIYTSLRNSHGRQVLHAQRVCNHTSAAIPGTDQQHHGHLHPRHTTAFGRRLRRTVVGSAVAGERRWWRRDILRRRWRRRLSWR